MYPLLRKLQTAARLATERVVHEFCAERLRPRIFILGAQKAGTTSLDFYLNQHPKLVGAAGKEAGFFSRDAMHARGQAWYARQFPGERLLLPGKQLFEATPEYLYYPWVPARIREYAPDARLLVLLREPVGRAWSAYTMFRNLRTDRRREHALRHFHLDANPAARDPIVRYLYAAQVPDFPALVEDEIARWERGDWSEIEPSFVRRGLYAEQLERWFAVFPREQILVLENRELRDQRVATLNRVCQFIGVEAVNWEEEDLKELHPTQYRDKPDPATVARLKEFYRPQNERLYGLLGQRYDW